MAYATEHHVLLCGKVLCWQCYNSVVWVSSEI